MIPLLRIKSLVNPVVSEVCAPAPHHLSDLMPRCTVLWFRWPPRCSPNRPLPQGLLLPYLLQISVSPRGGLPWPPYGKAECPCADIQPLAPALEFLISSHHHLIYNKWTYLSSLLSVSPLQY